MSTVNDVLKIQEVSTLVTQVSQMVENTQDKLATTKQKLVSFSFIDVDKTTLLKVISTVQDYQLHTSSHITLADTKTGITRAIARKAATRTFANTELRAACISSKVV